MTVFPGWTIFSGGRIQGLPPRWLAAWACVSCLWAQSIAAADAAAIAPVAPPLPTQASPQHHATAVEQRVALLAAELNLDARQQAEVRKVLEDQRRQVMKVWNDTAVPAAYRVSATRAISDRTGDRIRALLNEEQKAKYNPPRKPREPMEGSATPSVEDWMKATSPK